MSNLSLVEAKLPPGFRFHPKDEELVCDYLLRKITSTDSLQLLLVEVDLNKCEPWDIPETTRVGGKECYFYSQRDRKYATGLRTNRATASGYWKATGKDRAVLSKGTIVGMRKTLVFYQGRAPKGRKTDWIMHEFRLEGSLAPPNLLTLEEDWVLCRVFHKSREMNAKPKSCYEETGSSPLPPLTDSYINYEQVFDEQVPCFSILSQTRTNYINPNITTTNDDIVPAASSSSIGQKPTTYASCLDSFPCGRKVIKAVLNNLTELDSYLEVKDPSLALGDGSSESYLSEVGMPNIWS